MVKNKKFHMTELDSQIMELKDKTSIFRTSCADKFYREAVNSLISSAILQESLASFYDCLKRYMPVSYLVYMSSYGRHKASIMRISDAGVEMVGASAPLSLAQIKNMYHYRDVFSEAGKGIWITDPESEYSRHLNDLNPELGLYPPYVYFFMEENEKILGNMFFGCEAGLPFSAEQRALLDTLWEPLFFLTRTHTVFHEMETLLELTRKTNRELRRQISGASSVNIIGANAGLSALMAEVRIMAPTEIPVLLTGETGTGKEVVARELHNQSARRGKNFVAVNCGGIPPSLIDSELFGHVKGAFTGATRDYKGRFERAEGGTLFLDEIGELPMDAQTRLLRVLQERIIERVGGNTPIPVDFRLIAATNRDLPAMTREGRFREDLYFRLSGVTLRVPPLRERPQDIPLLVQHYLTREGVRMGMPPQPLAKGEMEKLLAYPWPGNVRELINVVGEGFARSQNGPVRFNLSRRMGGKGAYVAPTGVENFSVMLAAYFRNALAVCDGRISGPRGAAALIGVKPNTLRAKLDKLGIPYGRGAG